ncbi:Pectin degradation repressor protein KdgR [Variovorax sp. SRS16]|uniref:IclR family transcriptional regulator n=1 Tax=Variovorax sp. SRS16 TaxID=282217 RepID=UPI001317AD92|nr:IclR family transcriptional regulator [Variovorax sp. SRS16]VTU26804.1 Pectin degradation repressor protein KdgR [Variovorax sp. SRS16]
MSSLESAVSILGCFSSDTPELAVTEVAAKLAMPKSTVSRLMLAMAEQRLVEQDEATRRYRVGLLPFRLGQLYYAHVKVVELVEAEIEVLINETGFTGYVGVLNGADIVILRKRHGRYPVQMILDAGSRMAAATTAFGKALLARLPNEELGKILPPALVEGKSGARRPVARLLTELDTVRAQHWAIGDTAFAGMCAIGAAVGSSDDQQAIGFSLSFPDIAVNAAGRKAIADRVVDAARRVAVITADPFWAQRPAQAPSPASKGSTPRARTARHRPT